MKRNIEHKAIRPTARGAAALTSVIAVAALLAACGGSDRLPNSSDGTGAMPPVPAGTTQAQLIEQGREVFRHDTFGDEQKWTDQLRMHEAIATVDPTTALAVGLKVDTDALPASLVQALQAGQVDLTSPATTLALLRLNAVVGVRGQVETVNGQDRLTRVGITCALCHSTVDDSFAPGIGKRLDGWPNRDLNPGAIIALSPALPASAKAVFNSWGKGKYDPRFNIDGLSKPAVIPPAYGLQGVHRVTFSGDGVELAYWNRYVGVTQMGGQGSFVDTRLGTEGVEITNGTQDLISDRLQALQAYQLSIAAPPPPAGSFDPDAAERGKLVFEGAGTCASCHSGPLFTDANERLHPASDSMAEPESPSYAARSATRQYRTSPLRGVWQHAPYFHDGSAPTLRDVVLTYNRRRALGLSDQQIADLTEYLKSL